MKKVALSLTPVSLEKDSRTLKLAASFARKGYRSIVIEHIPSQKNFGEYGIEVFKANESPTLSLTVEERPSNNFVRKIAKLIWHGMRYIRLGFVNDFISFISYKKIYKEKYSLNPHLIPSADVYIFHSYEYLDFALSLPKESLIIYDAHDFYQEINPGSGHSSLVRKWLLPYQKKREKSLISRADIFLTVSDGLSHKYRKTFSKTPTVIRNTHDTRIDTNLQKGIRTILNLTNDDIIVCAVGNNKVGMALDSTIKAFSLLPPHYHLVFLGKGYEKLNTEDTRIHFLPAIPANEVVPFIKEANLGILLYFDLTENYKYALPNGFFQMLAAGLPLIFPQQLQEVCALHNSFSFGVQTNIGDINSIFKALNEVSDNRTFYKKNVNKFNEEINWAHEENKVFSLINDLDKLN
ncbi:MAG: glycosyltransferase family 4 protein [Alphaproteobacteria bacterium]|nr:glycosyltransferase family 4 protein [Alphaproteobacteria bacterium]